MAWPAPARDPSPLLRRLQLCARATLIILTGLVLAGVIAGSVASGHLDGKDWITLGVAALLAGAATWICVRPGRSTRVVCLSFVGVLLAGAPFLDDDLPVIRLYGFVLVNLAVLWPIVPRLGLVLRRNLRWILLGIGLYLIALSVALHARDEWRRYHGATSMAAPP